MEEISFKPSTKNDKFLLIIGIILSIAIIGIPLIIFSLIRIITKQFYIFTIRDNEIEINYKFISKWKKVYRIDQITSITLSRGLIQKWFGLGSVRFGIFGKTGFPMQNTQTAQNRQQNTLYNQMFFDIENYTNAFNAICEQLNITNNKIEYEDKPSTTPPKFWRNLWFILSSLFFGVGIFYIIYFKFEALSILIGISLISFGIIFLISYLVMLFQVKKIRTMQYSIKETSLDYFYDYVLSMKYTKVPLTKITNTHINKNLISYKLFKVGTVKIFTGGDHDPKLANLNKYENFHVSLSSKLDRLKTVQNTINNELNSHNKENKNEKLKPEFTTKPGTSFFLGTFFWSSIIFVPTIIGLFILNSIGSQLINILTGFVLIIYILIIIGRYILWKNTTYEFYSDRVIDKSGIININTKEIRFKNIKYVTMKRSFFFNRIYGEGNINLFTAGTGFCDNSISAIKEYDTVYKELKEVVLEQN